MKKLLLNPVALILAVLAAAYFLFIFLSWKSESNNFSTSYSSSIIDNPVNDTSYGGLFYKPDINDSLPHFYYKQIEDSLLLKNEMRLRKNETHGNSFTNGLLGFAKLFDGDHTTSAANKNEQYFFSIGGFELEEDVKFYIENNEYNLVYLHWDTVRRRGDDVDRMGTYKSVAIPVRYSKTDKKIFIPISAKLYITGSVVLLIIGLFISVFALFVIFGYPIQFLIRISKGQAFNEANVAGLRMTALLIFLYFIISLTFPFIIRVAFSSFIHPLFKPLKFWPQLFDHLPSLFLAIIVFAIHLAFKKGHKLQQEQDLTV